MFSEQREHSSIVGVKIKTSFNKLRSGSMVLTSLFRFFLFLAAVFVGQQSLAEADRLTLTTSETESTSGYFSLNWNQPKNQYRFILQQSVDKNFEPSANKLIEWQVANSNSFSISGLNSGTYYFRVAPQHQPESWSNTVSVAVKHHSLSKAFFIFSLGAIVFSLLTLIILFNNKNQSRGF